VEFRFETRQKAQKGQDLDIFSEVKTPDPKAKACSAVSDPAATSKLCSFNGGFFLGLRILQ
jgi:hypothetical protein